MLTILLKQKFINKVVKNISVSFYETRATPKSCLTCTSIMVKYRVPR